MNTNPEDQPAVRKYLSTLKESLQRIPGVRLEDGLADAHEFLRSEWESIRYGWSFLSDEDLYRHFVHKFGPPDEVASAYAYASEPILLAAEARRTMALHGVAEHAVQPVAASSARRSRFGPAWIRVVLAILAIQFSCLLAVALLMQKQRATAHALQDGPVWAGRIVSFSPGNPHSVTSNESSAALGPPDYQDGLDDRKQYHTWVSLGRGGQLVVEFIDMWLCDGSGPDLKIVELGPLAEPFDVAVSRDGNEWVKVGRAKGAEATIDLAPFVRPADRFRFVRLIDAKNVRSKDNEWPGADIDAIGALHVVKE